MEIRVYRYRREFSKPFPYFGSKLYFRHGVLLALRGDGPLWGTGECPWKGDSFLPRENEILRFVAQGASLELLKIKSPLAFAVSCATHQLGWQPEQAPPCVPTAAFLELCDPVFHTRLQARFLEGYRIFKLKPGPFTSIHAFDVIPNLPGVLWRVDANRSWDRGILELVASRLRNRGVQVDYFEEPCAYWRQGIGLGLPIALDESIHADLLDHFLNDGVPEDVSAFVFKAGGLGSWHDDEVFHQRVKDWGRKIVFSHHLESEAGCRALLAAHLHWVGSAPFPVGVDSLRYFDAPQNHIIQAGSLLMNGFGPIETEVLESLPMERVG